MSGLSTSRTKPPPLPNAPLVVLLHGLGRTPLAMKRLEWALRDAEFLVANVGYPSLRHDLATLSRRTLAPQFAAAAARQAKVHIVTHSMGAMLVRQYLHDHGAPAALGRVVMLAPPNGGSELIDHLRRWPLARALAGTAAFELGTDSSGAACRLGPVKDVTVGVIAGDRSMNPLLSALLPGRNDGKVSVERTKVAGMTDHVTVHSTHTWMLWRTGVISQVTTFLRNGHFAR